MTDENAPDGRVLDRLFATIDERRDADPESSYTAKLLSRGRAKVAQKTGEEAVEAVIAATSQEPADVASESADLLYHLLVLWAECGVDPDQVWQELDRRTGTSGITEKKARKHT
mgnify:CR=1 FL=1